MHQLCIMKLSCLLRYFSISAVAVDARATLECGRSSWDQARGVRQLSIRPIKPLLELPSIGLSCFDLVVLCQEALLILLQRPCIGMLHGAMH